MTTCSSADKVLRTTEYAYPLTFPPEFTVTVHKSRIFTCEDLVCVQKETERETMHKGTIFPFSAYYSFG